LNFWSAKFLFFAAAATSILMGDVTQLRGCPGWKVTPRLSRGRGPAAQRRAAPWKHGNNCRAMYSCRQPQKSMSSRAVKRVS